jgi:hypothetical protein
MSGDKFIVRAMFAVCFAWVNVVFLSADVVGTRPSPPVWPYVVVRQRPNTDSLHIGQLRPGEVVDFLDEDVPGWYHVSMRDGHKGYVSRIYTTRHAESNRSQDQTNGETKVQVTAFPALGSQDHPLIVKTINDPALFGIVPRDAVPLAAFFVAACGLGLSLYTGRQTNIRNRNETFRTFRERFETLRSDETNTKGWELEDFDEALGLTSQGRAEVLTSLYKEHAREIGQAALKELLASMQKYWIRTFDEWFITTDGGRGVGPTRAGWLGRTIRIRAYRRLWDDYYREAIARTVRAHPALLIGLIWLPSKAHTLSSPKETEAIRPMADQLFIRQMWWYVATEPVREIADSHLKIVNAWREAGQQPKLKAPPRLPPSLWYPLWLWDRKHAHAPDAA